MLEFCSLVSCEPLKTSLLKYYTLFHRILKGNFSTKGIFVQSAEF